MLRTLCTTAARHLRSLPTSFVPAQFVPLLFVLAQRIPERFAPAYAALASSFLPRRLSSARSFARQMAIPLAQPMIANAMTARPMAVPFDATEPSRASMVVAAAALAFSVAGLWRQDAVIEFTHVALDGLGSTGVAATTVDRADLPAMEPVLASVVDPRPKMISPLLATQRSRTPIKPFEYEVREGDTLDEIARRFGTEVDALLWNNGLETPDQVEPGARLMVLPVRGLLHLVKPGDTINKIAERYGTRPEDLAIANALDDPNHIMPDQVIVVAGGRVPAPQVASTQPGAIPQIAAMVGLTQPADEAAKLAVPQAPAATPTPDENLPNPPGAESLAARVHPQDRARGSPVTARERRAGLGDAGAGDPRIGLGPQPPQLRGQQPVRHQGPARSGSAGVYNINTWEVSSGQDIVVMAGFKAYTSVADSIADHGRWFHDNSRYHGALTVKDDPRAFARAIADAGYATDPAYPGKLIGLMDKYDLYAYDVTP